MANLYYYNDVILPELPDTGSYSNHYILHNNEAIGRDDEYCLVATNVAAYCSSQGVAFPTGTKALAWYCTDGGKEWRGSYEHDVAGKVINDRAALVWAHYDICYEDGGVYMEGCEPVLAVSQWDKMRRLVRGILAGIVSKGAVK